MDKYLTKRKTTGDSSEHNNDNIVKQSRVDINLADLPADPGLRIKIVDYNPTTRNEVRRAYLLKGPCQPRNHEFSYTPFGNKSRRFNPAWFDEYSNWLEYNVHQDATYCLCCYLFKPSIGAQARGESFIGLGLKNWARKDKLRTHVGRVNSAHNQVWAKCEVFLNKRQQIESVIIRHTTQSKIDYKIRLNASIDCVQFLLRQGHAFRGHDECETSNNKGNFIELLQFLVDHNASVKAVTFKNAHENLKLTSLDIQKDIVHAVATETRKLIVSDFSDHYC